MTMTVTAEAAITETLVESLLLVYPKGAPADEGLLRKWKQESLATMTLSSEQSDSDASNIYERALTKAMEEWKIASKNHKKADSRGSQKAQKKQPLSVSLFAQMDAGLLWGGPRIFLEDLQSTTSPEDRIDLLQKISHVDDVVMDWPEVLPMIQEGLETSMTQPMTWEYIQLHRKWFDQGRASAEYLPIRCDLCQNILTAIRKLVTNCWKTESSLTAAVDGQSFSGTHETLFHLWQLWHNMWFDLLQQPISHDEDIGVFFTIGHQVLILLRSLDVPSSNSTGVVVYPAHFLALVDPTASWFRAWTSRITPPELLRRLESSNILPDTWQRAISGKDECVSPDACKTYGQLLDVTLKLHSVSMLRSILVCTRLEQFPCSYIGTANQTNLLPQNLLSLESLREQCEAVFTMSNNFVTGSGDTNLSVDLAGITSEQVDQLFQLFLTVGKMTTKTQEWASISTEAIEVIISGARSLAATAPNFAGSYSQLLTLCKKVILREEKTPFDELLSETIKRVE